MNKVLNLKFGFRHIGEIVYIPGDQDAEEIIAHVRPSWDRKVFHRHLDSLCIALRIHKIDFIYIDYSSDGTRGDLPDTVAISTRTIPLSQCSIFQRKRESQTGADREVSPDNSIIQLGEL
jgi:hypothetical protein